MKRLVNKKKEEISVQFDFRLGVRTFEFKHDDKQKGKIEAVFGSMELWLELEFKLTPEFELI